MTHKAARFASLSQSAAPTLAVPSIAGPSGMVSLAARGLALVAAFAMLSATARAEETEGFYYAGPEAIIDLDVAPGIGGLKEADGVAVLVVVPAEAGTAELPNTLPLYFTPNIIGDNCALVFGADPNEYGFGGTINLQDDPFDKTFRIAGSIDNGNQVVANGAWLTTDATIGEFVSSSTPIARVDTILQTTTIQTVPAASQVELRSFFMSPEDVVIRATANLLGTGFDFNSSPCEAVFTFAQDGKITAVVDNQQDGLIGNGTIVQTFTAHAPGADQPVLVFFNDATRREAFTVKSSVPTSPLVFEQAPSRSTPPLLLGVAPSSVASWTGYQ